MHLVFGTVFRFDEFADGPLARLRFRAALVLLRLFGLAVTMLFAVCHGTVLQRLRRRDAVCLPLQEHTIERMLLCSTGSDPVRESGQRELPQSRPSAVRGSCGGYAVDALGDAWPHLASDASQEEQKGISPRENMTWLDLLRSRAAFTP